MVYDGNRDWVSANGNREVANVVMTNFNQPQGNPEMGQFSSKSSEDKVEVVSSIYILK